MQKARTPRFDSLTASSEAASRAKSRLKRRDTRAEIELRRALWKLGLRYRCNSTQLPGKPDIVFTRARVAVFCDGDFWHGRDWAARRLKLRAGSNASYWVAKIEANMARDARKTAELRALGWQVVRVWEGEILAAPDRIATAVSMVVAGARSSRDGSPRRASGTNR